MRIDRIENVYLRRLALAAALPFIVVGVTLLLFAAVLWDIAVDLHDTIRDGVGRARTAFREVWSALKSGVRLRWSKENR